MAAAAWWFSLQAPAPVGFPAFALGWTLMMTAMMLPALVPVLLLYQRAARRGTVAPVSRFLAGYLAVWALPAAAVYPAWQRIEPAVMAGSTWTGRVAGGALLVAAAYQLTPFKAACLRGCRSPLAALSAVRGSLARPSVAARVGARNGLWCVGCCWALIATLVTVGLMQPWWMLAVAAVIAAEKALPQGPRLSRPIGILLAGLGLLLLLEPALLRAFPY